MIKPERASRLWLVLALVMQKAMLLGGEWEAQEQDACGKRRRNDRRKKRRRGRPAWSQSRPRGREQRVLFRGIMALRAAETGGPSILPMGRVRTEPLPTRLSPVSRVPTSSQLKKQRREEKKRNRQRSKTKERRAERAAERAALQAEVQARRQARKARRAAKEAEAQARRLARRGKGGEANLRENPREETTLLSWQKGQPLASERHAWPVLEPSMGLVCQAPLLPTLPPLKRAPLLRLSRGRLQPPSRPVRTKIRQKEGQEPAQQAGPGKNLPVKDSVDE